MKVGRFGSVLLVIAATMWACSLGGTSSTGPTAPAATQPQQPAASLQPANTPSVGLQPQATSAGTALNPCDLVPQGEASTLANFQFDAGTKEDNPSGGSRCVYGSQATNVMTINVAQASDAATAQAYRDAFIADIQSQAAQLAGKGLTVTELPDFQDGAVQATLSFSMAGVTINGSAFGFLKGATFVGISDVTRGQDAPTVQALMDEMTNHVIPRLP